MDFLSVGKGGIRIWCHFGSIVNTQFHSFIHSSHAVCALLVCPFFRNNEKMMDGQRGTVTGGIGSPQASIFEALTQSIIECVLILRWGRYSGEEVGVSPLDRLQVRKAGRKRTQREKKAWHGRRPAEERTNAQRPDLTSDFLLPWLSVLCAVKSAHVTHGPQHILLCIPFAPSHLCAFGGKARFGNDLILGGWR